MKRLLLVVSFLASMVAVRATIVPVTDTANNLVLNFDLRDNIFSVSPPETYNTVTFPSSSITFTFQDRLFFFVKNLEQLSTNPSSGSYVFAQDLGDLDFSGSYMVGTTVVNWSVDSKLDTILGNDRWKGTFSAVAVYQSVPDAGSTAGLFGLGLVAMALLRRRR